MMKPTVGVLGRSTVFGVMPDWNPAEIIGTRTHACVDACVRVVIVFLCLAPTGEKPRPLALSLYKELVTDSVWAQMRSDYGYRDMTGARTRNNPVEAIICTHANGTAGHPLLVSFCGLPYIDVRASFNSFVPAAVPDALGEKLVNYYIQRLRDKPHLHDKVRWCRRDGHLGGRCR